MLTIYTYDENKEYSGESVTMLDPEETKKQEKEVWLMPPNSTTKKPVKKEGYTPVWSGSAWKQVEDHRGEKGWVNRESVVIKELGPLPKGFSTEQPEPTEEEKAEQRRMEIFSELNRIDFASARSLRAILTAQAAGKEPAKADIDKLAEHEADAKKLRAELAGLNA
jgi:hypothetical protein